MKRQKRFGKMPWAHFLDDAKEIISGNITTIVTTALFLAVAILLVGAFVHRSDYFRLKFVETKGANDITVSSYIKNELAKYRDVNIFDINVKAIARSLMMKYPDAKEIVIVRSLPDKLTVSINFRKPVALVGDLARFCPVDEDSYALSNADEKILMGLPVITGIKAMRELRPGKMSDSGNLKAALELLKEIKSAKFLTGHRPSKIEAGDINRLSFYLDDDIEIRIGYENLKGRLNALKNTLHDPRLVRDRVKYIDLRFEDVVIGPK